VADFHPLDQQMQLSQDRLEEAQVKTRSHIGSYATRRGLSQQEEGDLVSALLGDGLRASYDQMPTPLDR
jgi:hypothetical protein